MHSLGNCAHKVVLLRIPLIVLFTVGRKVAGLELIPSTLCAGIGVLLALVGALEEVISRRGVVGDSSAHRWGLGERRS